MNLRPLRLLSPAAIVFSLVGCAADDGLLKGDEGAATDEVQGVTVIGDLTYGASRTVVYAPTARQAYRFRGAVGDRVDVRVTSTRGDAMVWLFDPSGRVAAFNDDADGTINARVTHTLTRAGTWLVAFRDYHRQRQTFTVSLAGTAAAPDYTACTRDSECVVVSAGGCCGGWLRTAVRATSAEAYAAANTCRPPYPPCAQPNEEITARELTKVAICNAEQRCVAVQPEEVPCGGRTVNPRACPTGFACFGPGLARDIPGRCVRGCTAADGSTVAPDQSYSDGCNDCVCRAGGPSVCTRRACLQCTVGDRTYQPGETFPAACNTCTCNRGGAVTCTTNACTCDPAREPQRRYVANSPERCRLVRFACMAGEQMFSNECGCGCEPTR
jgi:hypothetical protein